jgi:hypothetical protein
MGNPPVRSKRKRRPPDMGGAFVLGKRSGKVLVPSEAEKPYSVTSILATCQIDRA